MNILEKENEINIYIKRSEKEQHKYQTKEENN